MSDMTLALAQEIAAELENADAARDTMFDGIEAMYKLDWANKPTADWIREAKSPQPLLAVRGICNLLSTGEPHVSIPIDSDEAQSKDNAGIMEKLLILMLDAASKRRQASVVYDMARMGTEFGLIVLKAARTLDQVRTTKGRMKAQYQRQAQRCPFVIDVLHPKNVHYLGGVHGVDCVVEHSKRTVSAVRAVWGDDLLEGMKLSDQVDFYEYWDDRFSFVWVNDELKALNEGDEEHGKDFIPYVVTPVADLPMLYPVWACKTWENVNFALTAQTSAAMNLAFPSLVLEAQNLDMYQNVSIDSTKPGMLFKLQAGDKLYNPLDRAGANENLMALLAGANQMMQDSTLNPVVFGQAPEGVTAGYSINTLMQGARLPLSPVQTAVCWGLAGLFELMLRWIVDSNESVRMWGRGQWLEITPDMVSPDSIEIDVLLQPKFPQDQAAMANTETTLTKAGLRSREKAIENLGNLQPQEELDRITKDLYVQALIQADVQRVVQAAQQAQQQAFTVPGEPPGPVLPEQIQQEMTPPVEQMEVPGMMPQQAGIQPMDQIAAIERGGGPLIGV